LQALRLAADVIDLQRLITFLAVQTRVAGELYRIYHMLRVTTQYSASGATAMVAMASIYA
jgi:hypothetical protein